MSSEVLFEEEANDRVGNIGIVSGPPKGMLAWLVKEKVVKTGKQAEQLLLAVTIGAVILTVGVFVFAGHGPSNSTPASLIRSDVLRMQTMHFTPSAP